MRIATATVLRSLAPSHGTPRAPVIPSGLVAVLTLASVVACGDARPTGYPGDLSVLSATETATGLVVEWRLARIPGGPIVTVDRGAIALLIQDRDLEHDEVVCTAPSQPVTADSFSPERGWSAITTFVFTAPCPPPPVDPSHTRVLRLGFIDSTLGLGEPNDLHTFVDPPAAMRTPTLLAASTAARERRAADLRASEAAAAPAREAASHAAAEAQIAAFLATFPTLAALVPAAPPDPPARCTAEVPTMVAPLVAYEVLSGGELVADSGSITNLRFHYFRNHADFTPTEVIELARTLDAMSLLWVRRTFERIEPTLVPGTGSATGADEFTAGSYRGGLYLIDRTLGRVLCSALVEATSSTQVDAQVMRGSDETHSLGEWLRLDLDSNIATAVETAGFVMSAYEHPFSPSPPLRPR